MFVPSYWHSRASTMARLCQYGGTTLPMRWHGLCISYRMYCTSLNRYSRSLPPSSSSTNRPSCSTRSNRQGTCRWHLHKGAIPGDGKGSGHTVWISRRSRRRSPPFGGCCSRFVHVLGYGQGFHNGCAPFR